MFRLLIVFFRVHNKLYVAHYRLIHVGKDTISMMKLVNEYLNDEEHHSSKHVDCIHPRLLHKIKRTVQSIVGVGFDVRS